ncbi:hypothetical protein Pmani_011786 [Petrolisthes manimaculis]|uniref:Uncharacterized protein n=1 Tax=Petrolisthes manimaculis TaxID=1843537 RepID=A0AAE1UFT1_9EUCA|nr:hypothetical protein Pmani_011786 [Petrolisthes manimaculis]
MIRIEFQARGSPHAHCILVNEELKKAQEILGHVKEVLMDPDTEESITTRELLQKAEVTVNEYIGVMKMSKSGKELSAQDAAYRLLSLPLQKKSRKVVFVNTSPKEKKVSMLKPVSILQEMDDRSDEVYCRSMLDRYAARPESLSDVCLA